MINDDVAGSLGGDSTLPPPLSMRQGVVQSWDPDTGDNTIAVDGGSLVNVPVLVAETAVLAVGDVVTLLGSGSRWCVLGKVLTPGDPGTVPAWNPDIFQLTTVTVPAVAATAAAAVVTADSAQADATAAQAAVAVVEGKFPITETDISDGAISTPKLAADAIDGMVITGAWIRTGIDPDGRIGLNDPGYLNQIVIYSGNASEETPARLRPATDGTNYGRLELRSPSMVPGDTGYAFIDMSGYNDGTTAMDLQAEEMEVISSNLTMMSTNGNLRLGDGTDYVVINGFVIETNGIPVSHPPKAFWTLASAQSIATGTTNINVTVWTADGATNSPEITMASGTTVTVTRAGLYRISCGLTYPGSATGRRYMTVFTPADVPLVAAAVGSAGASPALTTAQASRVVRLAAGASFRVTANQNSGGALALTTGNAFSYLQVEYVGP